MLSIGDKVRVKDSDIIGTVIRHGGQGLYNLELETEHSVFDRTVFGYWELEKIGGSENE